MRNCIKQPAEQNLNYYFSYVTESSDEMMKGNIRKIAMMNIAFILLYDHFISGFDPYISPFNLSDIHFRDDFVGKLLTLESTYCGGLCEFSFPLEAQYNAHCADCMCDPVCFSYGDCCPDINLTHSPTSQDFNVDCIKSALRAEDNWFTMVTSCTDDWPDDDVKANCRVKCSGARVDCYLPVTDMFNEVTYRNRFCAECNNITTFEEWKSYAKCESGDPILSQAKSAEKVFNHVIATNTCDVIFKAPDDDISFARPCTSPTYGIISKCNETGEWDIYDADIERACSMYTRIIKDTYKNMFCRLCNGPTFDYLMTEDGKLSSIEGGVTGVSLTALLQFGYPVGFREYDSDVILENVQDETETECLPNQLFDNYTCQCEDIYCEDGKYFADNACSSYISETNYKGYNICFHIKANLDQPNDDPIFLALHSFLRDVNGVIEDIVSFSVQVTKSISQFVFIQQCDDNIITELHSSFSVISPTVSNTDDHQQYLMELVEALKLDLEQSLNVTVTLREFCQSENTLDPKMVMLFDDLIVYLTDGIRFDIPKELLNLAENAVYIQLNRFVICPHVILGRDRFILRDYDEGNANSKSFDCPDPNVTREEDLIFIVNGKVLQHEKYLLTQENVVKMCVEDYEDLVLNITSTCDDKSGNSSIDIVNTRSRNTLSGNIVNMPTSSTLGILSLVCTCVSLFFLLLTLITYCLLPQLRTTGGVCNMGLIVTLFIAQALYEFGMEQYEDVLSCKIIGILIHFFWLAAVLWTNACVIQFFYRLCFPIRSRTMSSSTRRVFLVSCAYSYGVSFLIVALNIVFHHVVFGDVGYGGDICYLNTFYGQVITFSAIVGVITIANLVMFITTVISLSYRKEPTGSKTHKFSLFACVKLSTLTGLSWLFGYLYGATSIEVFAYVFTVLVGSQGLLLFLALMANRHVFNLFKDKTWTLTLSRNTASTHM